MRRSALEACGCYWTWVKGSYVGARYHWYKMTTCEDHRDDGRKQPCKEATL